jgi:hypothetical protein
MANKIQIRRDTTTNWAAVDPILSEGELGLDTTLDKIKIGDGTSHWSALSFYTGSPSSLVNGLHTVSLNSSGVVTFPEVENTQLSIAGSEIIGLDTNAVAISSNSSVVINTYNPALTAWEFSNSGTLTVPSPTSSQFTITFNPVHYVASQGKPTLTLTGAPWVLHGLYQYNSIGEVELQLDSAWPALTNPGYTSGDTFAFGADVHGVGGYTLTITLNDVVHPGSAGWTANVAASQPPAYPSTFQTNGAIKFTTGQDRSVIIDTNGGLHVSGPITRLDNQPLVINSITGNQASAITVDGDNSVVRIRHVSDLASYIWEFKPDGSLHLPPVGAIESLSTTSITVGTVLVELETTYIDSLIQLTDTFTLNSSESGYPWGITLPLSAPVTYDELILLPSETFPNQMAVTVQAHAVNIAYSEWRDALATNHIRFNVANKSWVLNNTGGITFPTLSVDLHNGGVQSGQVLKFNDATKQVIITGPTPVAGNSAERIIIQGQRATGNGEGGDVYIWGGDSAANGGDIKIYAGDGEASPSNGGYVNISGGSGYAYGGDVTLTAGYASQFGGNVVLSAGNAGGQGGVSGHVTINANNHSWTFNNEGKLTLPEGGDVVNSAGNSVLGGTDIYKFAYGIIGTKDSPDTGNWGGYNITLDPGGESYAGIGIPSVSQQDSGSSLYIYNNKSRLNNIQLSVSSGTFAVNGNGTIAFPGNKLKPTGALIVETTPGVPTSVTKTSSNQGWSSGHGLGTNLPTTGGSGTGLTVDVVDTGSAYAGITIHTPGSGYLDGETLTVTNEGMSDNFTVTVPVNNWTFSTTGNLTFPDTTIQTTAFHDVASNVFFVDPTRTSGTYTRTGTFTSPYNSITAAFDAAVAAEFNDSSMATVILLNNVVENITLRPGVFLTSLGTGTHGAPLLAGTVTVTSSTGTTVSNHYSISNLRIVAEGDNHCINFIGTAPQKLFMRDLWLDIGGTGNGIRVNNTGTGSTVHLDTGHLAHAGTGDVYCINVMNGNCYVTDIETTGTTQVAAVRSGCTLTLDSCELDANGDIVCETYGTGTLVITNSAITNAKANSTGILINDAGGTVTLGNNIITVPAGTGYAVQGPLGGIVYHANNVFTANSYRSTAIDGGFIALPNTWQTKA